MDFKSSVALYLIAGAVILFVLGQSIFFLVKAWKHGKELGIDKSKLKNAVTSSALFTIPSALSVLATVIALAPALGLVVPWVRLSVLGNITYETVAATEAINAFGITTGISEAITDPEAFAGVAWVMTIGICFSLVLLPFVAKPLHKKFLNAGKGKKKAEPETAVTEEKEEIEIPVSETTSENNLPINKKNIAICILLSFLTFGVYFIYWEYLLVKNVKTIKKDKSGCTKEMLCLLFVPFYSLYWWFTRGKYVKDEFTNNGYSVNGNETVYLLLGIFGLGIISMAIMQNDFNSLPADVVEKNDKSKKSATKRSFAGFIDHVTPALFIGLIGAFISNSILGAGKKDTPIDGAGVLSVITLATAVISSVIIELITKKFKLTWLEPFIMPIGMILGMVAAIVAYNVLPPEIAMLEWRG